jgi:hypothetical protein
MIKKIMFLVLSALVIFTVACGDKKQDENKKAANVSTADDNQPPRVIATSPENQDQYVDASINEISVTFNKKMMDGNWSWAYTRKEDFPQVTGQAYYTDDFTRCVLPVKLEAGKEYIIWINSETLKNFKDTFGNPAYPFKFTFKTR